MHHPPHEAGERLPLLLASTPTSAADELARAADIEAAAYIAERIPGALAARLIGESVLTPTSPHYEQARRLVLALSDAADKLRWIADGAHDNACARLAFLADGLSAGDDAEMLAAADALDAYRGTGAGELRDRYCAARTEYEREVAWWEADTRRRLDPGPFGEVTP